MGATIPFVGHGRGTISRRPGRCGTTGMRISGAGAGTPVAGRRGVTGGAAGGLFALPGREEGGGSRALGVGASAPMTSLEMMLALQATPEPAERRRRATRRAHAVLDLLEEVRVALLDGDMEAPVLARLRAEVSASRIKTDDPALDAILREVEVRAAVEAAKLEVQGGGQVTLRPELPGLPERFRYGLYGVAAAA